MNLLLPFPPKELSPNARVDWRVKAKAAADYKADCYILAVSLRNNNGVWPLPVPAAITVTFLLKDKRRRDLDNLIASFKPALDAMVSARLLVDDSVWSLTPTYRAEIGTPGVRVEA